MEEGREEDKEEEVEMTYKELLLWAARNNHSKDIEECLQEGVSLNH